MRVVLPLSPVPAKYPLAVFEPDCPCYRYFASIKIGRLSKEKTDLQLGDIIVIDARILEVHAVHESELILLTSLEVEIFMDELALG